MAVPSVQAKPAADSPVRAPDYPLSARPGIENAAQPLLKPVTIRSIQKIAESGERFACLTCYDYSTARWLEAAGIPVLLVGDSAAEVILGYPSTIHAPLDFLVEITAAVKRGAPRTLVMADMPFMSYQPSQETALINAGRFLTEGLADLVKIEVDRSFAPLTQALSHAGVPVVAHLGLKPQHVKREGGYRFAGRTAAEARELIASACAMQDAGAVMLLLEAMPGAVSERIVQKTSIPVIGCGAGPACHGQIVVLQDILGLSQRQPPFAKPIFNHADQLIDTAAKWNQRVKAGNLGEHPYSMNKGEDEQI